MIEDVAKIKDAVKVLLLRHPELRMNDELLILEVNAMYGYAKKLKSNQYGSGYFIPENLVRKRKLIKFESIRRVRQKLQEENPELRDKRYNVRQREAEAMRLLMSRRGSGVG